MSSYPVIPCLFFVLALGQIAVAQSLPPIDQIQSNSTDDPDPTTTDDDQQIEFADQRAARAFGPPPNSKRISRQSNLWINAQEKRIYIDGYVALDKGMLEMFACPTGTKEHESVLGVLAKSREVHAALLALGAKSGTTVRYDPSFVPPTGQQIRVWVTWRDEAGDFVVKDARKLIRSTETKQPLEEDWVFAGSSFWKDPVDGREYYQADSGDMICVSNFTTAMLDVPFASSASTGNLLFEPIAAELPPRETAVRLVLVPIPIPTDRPADPSLPKFDPNEKPAESILPKPTN